jgi:hypothetical protein
METEQPSGRKSTKFRQLSFNRVVSEYLNHFGNAPVSEELKEFNFTGSRIFISRFIMRLGYFNESDLKEKNFSLGAGFKYNVVKVDVSYLFSVASKVKPLGKHAFNLNFV